MKTQYKLFAIIISGFFLLSLACALPASIGSRIRGLIEDQAAEVVDQAEQIVEQNPTAVQEAQEAVQDIPPADEVVEQAEQAAGELLSSITSNDTSMLDSYRSSFKFNSESTNDSGSILTQTVEMTEEINRTQSLYHNKIEASGTGTDALDGGVDVYTQGDKTYLYDPSNSNYPCVMVSSDTVDLGDFSTLRPEDFFGSVDTGELVEEGVMINGVVSDHYRVVHTGMEMAETASESGDIWIAQDGGYIVRYIGSASGKFDTGEETGTGSMNWEYNLYDVNNVPIIDFPVECRDQQEAMDEIPVPDSAINKEALAGIITFESSDGPEQIGDFYREELPANGWRITEDSELASLVMMTAEKEDQSLQIMITPGETTGSNVLITTIPLN